MQCIHRHHVDARTPATNTCMNTYKNEQVHICKYRHSCRCCTRELYMIACVIKTHSLTAIYITVYYIQSCCILLYITKYSSTRHSSLQFVWTDLSLFNSNVYYKHTQQHFLCNIDLLWLCPELTLIPFSSRILPRR